MRSDSGQKTFAHDFFLNGKEIVSPTSRKKMLKKI